MFNTLGFKDFKTQLSFRDPENPDKYAGNIEHWEKAQIDIQEAADAHNLNYDIVLGEASFYGPKLDFVIRDVLGRNWQLGTVQVDYVMPERFNLEYIGSDNQKHRPVVIHRAPFGSMERFMGILIEHFAGAFPVWLAPVQVTVQSITDEYNEYAKQVCDKLKSKELRAELDDRSEKIGYKIREAEFQKIPYMLIVGKEEVTDNLVAVRKRKQGDLGKFTLDDFLKKIKREILEKSFN